MSLSNHTNYTLTHTSPRMPLDLVLIGTLSYTLVFIFGLFGNFLVVYVLLKEKELRNFTNYLLANLSIADLLVLLTNVPIGLHDIYAKERWYLGKAMCYLVYFFENCMSFASILSIFLITCERFYVICRPLSVKSLMTHSFTLKLIIFIWLLAILLNFPLILMANYRIAKFHNNEVGYKCELRADAKFGRWRRVYIVSITFVFYFFIGFFISYMYANISKHLKKSTILFTSSSTTSNTSENNIITNGKKINKSHIKTSFIRKSSNTNSICGNKEKLLPDKQQQNYSKKSSKNQESNNNNNLVYSHKFNDEPILNISNNLEKYIKPRKQLIKMLMYVIIIFYICLFPLKIWNILLLFSDYYPSIYRLLSLKGYWYINIIVHVCFYMNSMINPILYNFLSKKFRASFRKIGLLKLFLGRSSGGGGGGVASGGNNQPRNHEQDEFDHESNNITHVRSHEKKRFFRSIVNIIY